MNKAEKDALLEKRIITPQSAKLKEAYNKERIPSLEEIESSEFYGSMKRFDIEVKRTINRNRFINMPESIILQYLGKNDGSEITKDIMTEEFMFWHSRRGINTEMIIIPTCNYELLQKIGEPANKFIGYFEAKDNISLERVPNDIFIIKGIPREYTHPGRTLRFYSKDNIYVHVQKLTNHPHNPYQI